VSFWPLDPVRRRPPRLDSAEQLAALTGLARLHAVSGTARSVSREVEGVLAAGAFGDRPLRIVDVACGGGDVTIAVARRLSRWAVEAGLTRPERPPFEILGIDGRPEIIARARERSAAAPGIRIDFAVRDVLTEGCPPCDVALCTLLLHRLDDGAAEAVLRSLASTARLGGVVTDLVRSPAGLALATLATLLLTRSRSLRVDGPAAVRSARTPAEYRAIAARAGLSHAAVRRVWPERMILAWKTAEPVAGLLAGIACA
jgi:SAM-dependent methyltransferase